MKCCLEQFSFITNAIWQLTPPLQWNHFANSLQLLFLISIFWCNPVQIINIWYLCRIGCPGVVQIISLFIIPSCSTFLLTSHATSQSVTWAPPPLPSQEIFSFFMAFSWTAFHYVISIMGSWFSSSLHWSLSRDLDADTVLAISSTFSNWILKWAYSKLSSPSLTMQNLTSARWIVLLPNCYPSEKSPSFRHWVVLLILFSKLCHLLSPLSVQGLRFPWPFIFT